MLAAIAQPDRVARGYKGRWIAQKAAGRHELESTRRRRT